MGGFGLVTAIKPRIFRRFAFLPPGRSKLAARGIPLSVTDRDARGGPASRQRWVGLPTLSLPGGIPQAVRCQGRRAGPGDLHGVAPVSEVVGPVVCQGESRPYFESRTFRTDVSTWPILSPGDPIITRERDVVQPRLSFPKR